MAAWLIVPVNLPTIIQVLSVAHVSPRFPGLAQKGLLKTSEADLGPSVPLYCLGHTHGDILKLQMF